MASRIERRSAASLRTPSAPGEGPVYRQLALFAGFVMRLISREEWDDARQLPPTGGVLVVGNHVTYIDVLALGRYLIWNGRWPRYLGKSELWKIPVVGWLARQCHQIPVKRGTAQAKDSLAAARAALEEGRCIAIFPEGGRTRDPKLWPMRVRTGAARLALSTGVPVIPTAHWGSHLIMPARTFRIPKIWPKQTIRVVMGDPVDLADLMDRPDDPHAIREASDRIMAAILALVADLRGEPSPDQLWDARRDGRS